MVELPLGRIRDDENVDGVQPSLLANAEPAQCAAVTHNLEGRVLNDSLWSPSHRVEVSH